MSDEVKPLSKKWQAFVDQYFLCNFNGTEAYMRVYSPKSRDTARANAADLLANPSIAAEIQERLNEVHMSADEALKILAEHARGDVGEFLDISSVGFSLDLEEAQKKGITKLIKKIEQKVITINGKQEDKEIITTRIELHDPQAAAEKILRIHGKFTEKVDISNSDGSLSPALPDEERLARMKQLAVMIAEQIKDKDA